MKKNFQWQIQLYGSRDKEVADAVLNKSLSVLSHCYPSLCWALFAGSLAFIVDGSCVELLWFPSCDACTRHIKGHSQCHTLLPVASVLLPSVSALLCLFSSPLSRQLVSEDSYLEIPLWILKVFRALYTLLSERLVMTTRSSLENLFLGSHL